MSIRHSPYAHPEMTSQLWNDGLLVFAIPTLHLTKAHQGRNVVQFTIIPKLTSHLWVGIRAVPYRHFMDFIFTAR